jgi:hypothetical protein
MKRLKVTNVTIFDFVESSRREAWLCHRVYEKKKTSSSTEQKKTKKVAKQTKLTHYSNKKCCHLMIVTGQVQLNSAVRMIQIESQSYTKQDQVNKHT